MFRQSFKNIYSTKTIKLSIKKDILINFFTKKKKQKFKICIFLDFFNTDLLAFIVIFFPEIYPSHQLVIYQCSIIFIIAN